MERSIAGTTLVILMVVKIAMIVFYGPLIQPDSGGYITFADTMLSLPGWWIDRPDTLGEDAYRMIGYPAVIAVSKIVFGEAAWGYAVLVLQALIGTIAAVMVYGFAREALRDWRWGLLVAVAYATSQAIVYDVHILTDSIYGHGLAILIAVLGLQGMRQGRGWAALIVAACLLVSLFLVREFTLYLLPAFVPLVAIAAWPVVRRPALCAVLCCVVALPTILTAYLYTNWNTYRTGEGFITTAARTAALLPLVQFEERGVRVFEGDSVLDVAARENLSTYFYADVLEINRALRAAGVSGVSMSEMARDRFLETLWAHPLVFLKHVGGELKLERLAKALANPVTSIRDLEAIRTDHQRVSFSKWLSGSLELATVSAHALMVTEGVIILTMMIIGIFAFLIFPAWYLARLVLRRGAPVDWNVYAGIWASCAGTMVAYSMIRLEDRYLIGFTPFLIVIGLSTIRACWQMLPRFRTA